MRGEGEGGSEGGRSDECWGEGGGGGARVTLRYRSLYPIAIPIPCPARAGACLGVVAPLVLQRFVRAWARHFLVP
jgi:hypothetical protein